MIGVGYESVKKISDYGYRIVLKEKAGQEVCSIYERRDTEEEKQIIRISPVGRDGKIEVEFLKEESERTMQVDSIFFEIKEGKLKFSCQM